VVTFFQPFISLLEPKIHTPAATLLRCPTLFAVGSSFLATFFEQRTHAHALHALRSLRNCLALLRQIRRIPDRGAIR